MNTVESAPASSVPAAPATPAGSQRQLCTFRVDGLLFGLDVTQVQEVIRHQPLTPVPLSSPVVRGLINLRGNIVSALDMRRRLGLAPLLDDTASTNVVVRRDTAVVSLLVDEIGDVVDVDESLFESVPGTLSANVRELVLGVYKLQGQLLLLLNAESTTRVDAHRAIKGSQHV